MHAQVDPREAQLAKATRCQLSGEVLSTPIAADELGHLFNKGAVVSAMVARTLPPALAHISRCLLYPYKWGASPGRFWTVCKLLNFIEAKCVELYCNYYRYSKYWSVMGVSFSLNSKARHQLSYQSNSCINSIFVCSAV